MTVIFWSRSGDLLSQSDDARIRAARADDIPHLIQLERTTATAPHWSDSDYRAIAKKLEPNSGNATYIALIVESPQEKRLLGFLMAQAIGTDCEIENIVVAESERRRGLGSRLVQEFKRIASARAVANIFLEVRESNQAAIRLYVQNGFRQEGRRKDYYRNPDEDALLLRLALVVTT
jgi:ribosomal-protein-alanine N-acetyltransferase